MSTPQISFRPTQNVRDALERGRVAHKYVDQSEYLSALILYAADRVSGLDHDRVQEAIHIIKSLSWPITQAIALIDEGSLHMAVAQLRNAQTKIAEALLANASELDTLTTQRLRIRGDSSSWSDAERATKFPRVKNGQ